MSIVRLACCVNYFVHTFSIDLIALTLTVWIGSRHPVSIADQNRHIGAAVIGIDRVLDHFGRCYDLNHIFLSLPTADTLS